MKAIELSDETLDMLAKKISDNLRKDNNVKLSKDRAFHNTKLLLRNYHKLKAHVVVVAEQLEEDKDTFWNHGYLTLTSLMQNKAKTVKLMKQVDNALDKFESLCKEKGSRSYDLLEFKYFNKNMTDEIIAERYGVTRQSINNQLKEAVEEFSVLLFGADAIAFQ